MNTSAVTGSASALQPPASKQTEQSNKTSFSDTMKEVSQQATEAFYQIHQRSQITGVPTNEYNQAMKDIGFQPGENLDAIRWLGQQGYATGAPSVEAILKYGNQADASSNRTYMNPEKNPAPASQQTPAEQNQALDEHLAQMNAATNNLFEDASNYYEAAETAVENTGESIKAMTLEQVVKQHRTQAGTTDLQAQMLDDLLRS